MRAFVRPCELQASHELPDVPLFYNAPDLFHALRSAPAKLAQLHVRPSAVARRDAAAHAVLPPQAALRNAGHRVSVSHTSPNAIKARISPPHALMLALVLALTLLPRDRRTHPPPWCST